MCLYARAGGVFPSVHLRLCVHVYMCTCLHVYRGMCACVHLACACAIRYGIWHAHVACARACACGRVSMCVWARTNGSLILLVRSQLRLRSARLLDCVFDCVFDCVCICVCSAACMLTNACDMARGRGAFVRLWLVVSLCLPSGALRGPASMHVSMYACIHVCMYA